MNDNERRVIEAKDILEDLDDEAVVGDLTEWEEEFLDGLQILADEERLRYVSERQIDVLRRIHERFF